MTNRELDALVAEKVMGWRLLQWIDEVAEDETWQNDDGWYWDGRGGDYQAYEWEPTTNISDAWLVVEKLINNDKRDTVEVSIMVDGTGALVNFYRESGDACPQVSADTAPKAICLAALKAVGMEAENG